MKRLSSFIAFVLCLGWGAAAQAEIYKCTSPQGKVSFATVPCEPYKGETTTQRAGPPLAIPDLPAGHVHEVNLQAIENLRVSGKANTYVIEGENYKKLQRNRLPPPSVASQCVSPNYDSHCFDPSGGKSSFDQALRKSAQTHQPIPSGLPGNAGRR